MTTDITNPDYIKRQFAMRDLGLTVATIRAIMTAPDDQVFAALETGRAQLPTLTGDTADRAKMMLAAFEIEAASRKGR